MITLVQFAPALGMRNPSPFCLKVEALLRMSALPWTPETGDPRGAPKGRLPFVRDGGESVADSAFIREHLQSAHGIDFDAGLTTAERATARAFTLMCEDHLYWALVTSRWRDETNWPRLREAFFADVPSLIRPFVGFMVRRSVLRKLDGQGFGAHSPAEVYALGGRALDALADQIADRPYLMGSTRCGADATVYATLHSILASPLDSPLKAHALTRPQLVAYERRLDRELFDDLTDVA